ncbi:MAG: phosphatidate cytidylyltransferase [Deltaproteobacteria bacterium]|nr:phosphatidate cytidylyltransferase [Deltaproteobacteria bacterium]
MRLATSAVAIPLLIALLYLAPPWAWLLFIFVVAVTAASELFGMTHAGERGCRIAGVLLTWVVVGAIWLRDPRVLLTVMLLVPFAGIVLGLARPGDLRGSALRIAGGGFGPLYLGAGLGAVAALRLRPGGEGPAYVLLALTLAWMSDTGGYFAGRLLGRHKLYPAVSPKKTVEGAVGAVAGSVIGALVARMLILPRLPLGDAALLGVLGSVLGQLGDLGESLLKRSAGIKDSGGIVPGHGGMLDRIDAVMITAPMTLLYTLWRAP